MADFTGVPSVELLTRAADAAGRAAAACEAVSPLPAAWPDVESLLTAFAGLISPADARLVAASGPDHWRAVEATFRKQLERHVRFDAVDSCQWCGGDDDLVPFPCPPLDDLRDLAEQVLGALGGTDGAH